MFSAEQYATAYEEYYPRTIRLLAAKGVPTEQREDVASWAWARGWEKRHQFREQSSIATWIIGIAWNRYRSDRRKRTEGSIEDLEVKPSYRDNPLKRLIIEQCLRRIPATDRHLLQARFFEGLNFNEAAVLAGLPVQTAKVRVFRALRQARQRYFSQ